MHARSTTVRGSPEAVDQGIAMVRDEVLPQITSMEGCAGLSMLVSRESGQCIVTTSWESLDAMHATEQVAAPLRERASDLLGGAYEVDEWEVAVMHRAHHTPEGGATRSTWLGMPPDQVDRAVDVFRMVVLEKVEQLDGFCSALLMVDRDNGRLVATVAFDDMSLVEATRDTARTLRTQIADEVGAEILDVQEHEVAIAHLHVPEMA
ncbi:hypothetical protein [Nocardioides coralli]|uniref:hypothetical protein n=1 Tax=Nocardioides coralli TaxID=2872154 RepID=UPI001CA3C60F|nr:hypothetical protein [Nocardioides coralli]QZY30472.1 hypothetical protein K6T13_07425 [Nocardioides coralli]